MMAAVRSRSAGWPAGLFGLVIVCGCGQADEFVGQVVAWRSGATDEIVVRSRALTDQDVPQLKECAGLRRLHVYRSELTEAGLAGLSELTQLEILRLEGRPISDEGVQLLCRLTDLRVLNLPSGGFTEAAIVHIAELPHLELLRLGGRGIKDESLATLSEMRSLRFLHLIGASITDVGLGHLCDMHQLESLYLDGTQVTDAGIRDLLRALPELHFHRDQTHVDGDPNRDGH